MIVKINGLAVEGVENFAQTKQANDIADISSRQSNFSQMRVPKTATNAKIFDLVNGMGSNSNFPYVRNSAEVIDEDTGLHLITNGFAVMREVADSFTLAIYDGFIEFAKLIENRTLFEIGLSDLNHVKNVDEVIDSWTDDEKQYRYLIADYNGKNFVNGFLNIDYQVPSAKVSYLWERIFEFAGWSYSGAIFDREDFQDLFLTYPKPAPTDEPVVIPVTEQTSEIVVNFQQIPTANGFVLSPNVEAVFLPNNINPLTITGNYRIKITGDFFLDINLVPITTVRVIVTSFPFSPTYDEIINFGTNSELTVFVEAGQSILLFINTTQLLSGSVTTAIDLIDGFVLGFDQAFIDFRISDFMREIMVRFGLTPITDNRTKHIKFLTLAEKLQTEKRLDWSDKFVKASKTFVFKDYAKSNDFKFRYNEENEKHENGDLKVLNENLAEVKTAFQSSTYAPERNTLPLLGFNTRTFRIWNKELKDDGEIEYKDLEGRFYFVKAERADLTVTIESELLNQSGTSAVYWKASYFRCSWSQLLIDFYTNFRQIVSRSKVFKVQAWLTKKDIEEIKFDELVYFKQLGGYGFINKINPFRKNQPTEIEVVGVDFFTEPTLIEPPLMFMQIVDSSVDSCTVFLDVETNISQPTPVTVRVYLFDGFQFLEQPALSFQSTLENNVVEFSATTFGNGFYKFDLIAQTGAFNIVTSNQSESLTLTCFSGVDSFVRIDDVKLTSQNLSGILKTYDYTFTLVMDLLTLPLTFTLQFFQGGFWSSQVYVISSATILDNLDGTMTIIFNITYNSFFAPAPTKTRVIFGSNQSTEFDL
jgi:hypothetical protein